MWAGATDMTSSATTSSASKTRGWTTALLPSTAVRWPMETNMCRTSGMTACSLRGVISKEDAVFIAFMMMALATIWRVLSASSATPLNPSG